MKRKIGLIGIVVLMAICSAFIFACNVSENTPKTLSSIEITAQPTKTTYTAGETFDPSGMVVTAKYSDNSSEAVTGYTYKTDALELADTLITVSFTKDSVTKTADVAITVNSAAEIVNAETPVISSQPQGTTINVGTTFDLTVTAGISDGGGGA